MSKTLGILGRKIGMTRIFGDDGAVIPVTVISTGPCAVLKVKTAESKDGYNAIQVGFEQIDGNKLNKPERGDQAKSGAGFFRHVKEFRLDELGELAAGQTLDSGIFKAGDKVKVTGTSIGKGFQGPMKRHNMAGANATHGAEKVHRSGGSIGNNTFPGKVWKGKRMAGHMGAKQVTAVHVEIVAVRPEDNVILIKGQAPGPKNGLVVVRKAS